MGAGLAVAGFDAAQAARDSLGGARPESIPSVLHPLLALSPDGLCEARHRLAVSGLEQLPATRLAPLLGLPLPACRRLCLPCGRRDCGALPSKSSRHRSARPQSAVATTRGDNDSGVGVAELLCTLAFLSHTHEQVKLRFIFSLFDRTGSGFLDFDATADLARALLRTAGCLSQPPVDTTSVARSAELLVLSFLPRGMRRVRCSDLTHALLGLDLTCRFLRRFARGAVGVPLRVESWQTLRECSMGMPTPKDRPSIMLAELSAGNRMPIVEEVQLPAVVVVVAEPPSVSDVGLCRANKPNPALLTEAHIGAHVAVMQVQRLEGNSIAGSNYGDGNDESSVPKRPGYFQAVPSPDAANLLQSLASARLSKQQARFENDRGRVIDLEAQEDALVADLWREAADQEKRFEYRRLLQALRRQSPGGRLWTASRAHVVRGGVLPYNFDQPLSPEDVRLRILQAGGGGRRAVRKTEVPSRADRRVALNCAEEESDSGRDAMVSLPSSSSLSEAARSMSEKLDSSRVHVPKRDVMLAFELFRTSYWRYRQADDRSVDRSIERRNRDIDAILAEQAVADERPKTFFMGCSSTDLTLKAFFHKLWAKTTRDEISVMLEWVAASKTLVQVQARVEPPPAEACVMRLRDLVALFDAGDTERSGRISLDNIERFLCGEIITERQAHLLKEYHHQLNGTRSVIEYLHYTDLRRDVHSIDFLHGKVQDRREWSLIKDPKGRKNESESDPKHQAQAMAKSLARHLEKLGSFLDEACGKKDPTDTESILTKNIDHATRPRLVDHGGTQAGEVSLARLYYRHLLGSALQAVLRTDGEQAPVRLKFGPDGKLDLVSFMSLMAADQVIALTAKGQRLSESLIRRAALGVT